MHNYEYIIAGLPLINQNISFDADALIGEIRDQLDNKDRRTLDFFLSAFSGDTTLNGDFYKNASKDDNSFIRDYFDFDLNVRNLKVKYLNNRLLREADKDLVVIDQREECEYAQSVNAILVNSDILKRERSLDDFYWAKIDEMNLWDLFNLNLVLGFVAKIKIIDRWNKLDIESGRELFRKLVEEIRTTYDNKKNNII